MSKLEQLIEQLCPDGVEYRMLDELGSFYGGITGKSKKDFKDGNAKFITYKNVYSNPALVMDVPDRVKISNDENQRTLEYGDIIFTGSSETPDECGISSVLTTKTDEKLYLNSFCFFFRLHDTSILLPDYSKHLFRSNNLRYQIGKTAFGVTRFNISKDRMKKVIIPIPPIEVQAEIIKILDSFIKVTEELISKLTMELTARNKQFDYYRNIFLISESAKEYALSEICEIIDCPHTSPKWKEEGIPVIRNFNLVNGQINTTRLFYVDEEEYKTRIRRVEPQENDIMFSREAPIGNVGIIPAGFKCCQGQRVVLLRPNPKIVAPRYLLHYLQSHMVQLQISNIEGKRATVSNFNIADLRRLKLNIPELHKQILTVHRLDAFSKICYNIKKELPTEIQLRKRQYKYYRDKLLTFKEMK